jgi:hypothetical protein
MICNFSDDQAGNVAEPTPDFELELEIYLIKEPASMYIIKWDQSIKILVWLLEQKLGSSQALVNSSSRVSSSQKLEQ